MENAAIDRRGISFGLFDRLIDVALGLDLDETIRQIPVSYDVGFST